MINRLTENQKDLCRSCLNEFLNDMGNITKKSYIPIIRVCSGVDKRKKIKNLKLRSILDLLLKQLYRLHLSGLIRWSLLRLFNGLFNLILFYYERRVLIC